MRRILDGLLGASLIATLTSCSAPDITGVTLSDAALPVVTNCGTWITAVDARDAETDRVVWSASMTAAGVEQRSGAGAIELGRLPDPDWIERSPLAIEPRPETWRIAVETEGADRMAIELVDVELAPGRVVRPGHDTVSTQQFWDDVCGYAPLWPAGTWALAALASVAPVVVVMAAMGSRRRSRRTTGP